MGVPGCGGEEVVVGVRRGDEGVGGREEDRAGGRDGQM